MSANEKRLQELQNAQKKLIALVDAIAIIGLDSTARELLVEVLANAGYGPGLKPDGGTVGLDDYEHIAILALAHCYARIEVEQAAASTERAA